MVLSYISYCYSEHFDEERYVIVNTNGYKRLMRTREMCEEMDANPELIDLTDVII